MELPARIQSNLLFVTSRPVDRLCLLQRVVATVLSSDSVLVAVVGKAFCDLVASAAKLGEIDPRRVTIASVDDSVGDGGPAWQEICASVDRLVSEASVRSNDRQIALLVDLDAVFDRCNAASEMISVVYHLDREHASHGRVVASMVAADALPKSLPLGFFDTHGEWVFGENVERGDSGGLDRTAERLSLDSSEFRQRFLATGSGQSDNALWLLPRTLEDLRYGILIVDRHYSVRFCSPKAAELLGRTREEVVDRALSSCVDGVDLVTVKHECEKLTPGRATQPPFIASWRIAPGVYEPRVVIADPVRSGHQTIGYLLSLSAVESVRGPRAVYQQLKAEKADAAPTSTLDEDEALLTGDELVSGDLHGTQITRREHEIILLILKEMTNRQIAEHLRIAEVTVKKHLTSVYRKLRITSRQELALSFSRPGSER